MTVRQTAVSSPSFVGARRWWWTSGIGAVLLFLCLAFFLPGDSGGDSAADIAARYADNQDGFMPGMYVAVLSTVLQLVFVGVVSAQLAGARTRPGPLALVAAATGAVAAALQLVALAVIASLAYRTAATVPVDVTAALADLSSILSVFSCPPQAVFLACASVGVLVAPGRRGPARVLLAGLGFLLAAAHLAAGATLLPGGDPAADTFTVHGDYNFLTMLGFLAWMAAVSVFWFRPGRSTTE